jgi:hypothetical protein
MNREAPLLEETTVENESGSRARLGTVTVGGGTTGLNLVVIWNVHHM